MFNDIISNIIGFKNITITNIEFLESILKVHISLNKTEQNCPLYNKKVREIHDYRTQEVKDLKIFDKETILVVKKKCYRCSCGKRFLEKNDFLLKWKRTTKRLFAKIIELCASEISFTMIGKLLNLPTNTVIRAFDYISYSNPNFENVTAIVIDEFKGNTGGEKYNCVITDLETGNILDILPDRRLHKLFEYFSKITRDIRNNVEYFISDMWTTYKEVKEVYFKKSEFIVDKYHWIRQMDWAFERVRKEEQNRILKEERRYIKRSKKLLKPRYSSLTSEQQHEVSVIIHNHHKIGIAYTLKERFYNMLYTEDLEEKCRLFKQWIFAAEESGLEPFVKCARTYQNWVIGIKNSMKYKYTNGFTEGCNNKIKVLKRVGYGYKNFRRFRNRILHMFNYSKYGISL